jgi:hypothetical protein
MKTPSKATTKPIKHPPKKRGGARENAGRPGQRFNINAFTHRMPLTFKDGIEKAGIDNLTAYINYLVAIDLTKRLTGEADNNDRIVQFCKDYLSSTVQYPV